MCGSKRKFASESQPLCAQMTDRTVEDLQLFELSRDLVLVPLRPKWRFETKENTSSEHQADARARRGARVVNGPAAHLGLLEHCDNLDGVSSKALDKMIDELMNGAVVSVRETRPFTNKGS